MKWLKFIVSLVLLIILFTIIRYYAGRFLVVNEPPRKADVIIVIDGGASEELGIKYYHLGYAPYLIFTRGNEDMRTQAINEGVPASSIIIEDRADSTYENASYSKIIMEQHGFKSGIVVAIDYHSRRTMLVFSRVFKNTGTTFTFSSAKDPGFNPTSWWSHGRNIHRVFREYSGILALYAGLGPYITDTLINRTPLLSYLFNS